MRLRPTGVVFALALAVAPSGCAGGGDGDDGIATANGGASPSATASAAADLTDEERALKFAQCMREHGVDMPDPEQGEGGFGIELGPGSDRAKVDAAMQACREYAPFGGGDRTPDPEMEERMRALAKCMRENGVPNFPDPQEGGGIQIGPESGIDPHDPTFKAAQEKCHQEAGLPEPQVQEAS